MEGNSGLLSVWFVPSNGIMSRHRVVYYIILTLRNSGQKSLFIVFKINLHKSNRLSPQACRFFHSFTGRSTRTGYLLCATHLTVKKLGLLDSTECRLNQPESLLYFFAKTSYKRVCMRQ